MRNFKNYLLIGAVAIILMTLVEPAKRLFIETKDRPNQDQALFRSEPDIIPTPVLKKYVVALKPIAKGAVVDLEALGLRALRRENVPVGALTDPDETVRKLAKTDIVPGQLLVQGMLVHFEFHESFAERTFYQDACFAPNQEGVMICVTRGDQYLFSTNRQGDEFWRTVAERTLTATLLFVEDKVFFWRSNDRLYAVEAKSGQEVWTFQSSGIINDAKAARPVIISDKLLFWRDSSQTLCALTAATGEELWCAKTEGKISNLTIVDEATLTFISGKWVPLFY